MQKMWNCSGFSSTWEAYTGENRLKKNENKTRIISLLLLLLLIYFLNWES